MRVDDALRLARALSGLIQVIVNKDPYHNIREWEQELANVIATITPG